MSALRNTRASGGIGEARPSASQRRQRPSAKAYGLDRNRLGP